jgi:hypothetical protein
MGTPRAGGAGRRAAAVPPRRQPLLSQQPLKRRRLQRQQQQQQQSHWAVDCMRVQSALGRTRQGGRPQRRGLPGAAPAQRGRCRGQASALRRENWSRSGKAGKVARSRDVARHQTAADMWASNASHPGIRFSRVRRQLRPAEMSCTKARPRRRPPRLLRGPQDDATPPHRPTPSPHNTHALAPSPH